MAITSTYNICYTIRMPPENSFSPLRCLITLYYTYIYELQNIKSFFSVPLFLRFCVYSQCFTAALKSKPQNVCAISKNNITFISFNVVKNACTRSRAHTNTLTFAYKTCRQQLIIFILCTQPIPRGMGPACVYIYILTSQFRM